MEPATPSTNTGTLLLRADDLDRAEAHYTALGIRTVLRRRAMLVVELPCGVHLMLFKPWGGARPSGGHGVVARKTRAAGRPARS